MTKIIDFEKIKELKKNDEDEKHDKGVHNLDKTMGAEIIEPIFYLNDFFKSRLLIKLLDLFNRQEKRKIQSPFELLSELNNFSSSKIEVYLKEIESLSQDQDEYVLFLLYLALFIDKQIIYKLLKKVLIAKFNIRSDVGVRKDILLDLRAITKKDFQFIFLTMLLKQMRINLEKNGIYFPVFELLSSGEELRRILEMLSINNSINKYAEKKSVSERETILLFETILKNFLVDYFVNFYHKDKNMWLLLYLNFLKSTKIFPVLMKKDSEEDKEFIDKFGGFPVYTNEIDISEHLDFIINFIYFGQNISLSETEEKQIKKRVRQLLIRLRLIRFTSIALINNK